MTRTRWALAATLLLVTSPALADDAVTASGSASASAPPPAVPAPNPDDAPPPAPYAKGLVVDTNLGALGFLGKFGKLAPPGPWFHTQIGYELFSWLMVYGEGELAFTDTSNEDHPPAVRAFEMFGFGGGIRFTWRFTDRLGIYGQPTIGEMKANVPKNELANHDFVDAESFKPWLGLRIGFEWYQIDRHLALGVTSSLRTLTGFAKTGAGSDTPLAIDGGVALRYSF